MDESRKKMREIHDDVAPDYYDTSMKENLFQRFWHSRRIDVMSDMLGGQENVLDIGCGGGTLIDLITNRAGIKKSAGVDMSKKAIQYANVYHKGPKFLCADFYELPFTEKSFNVITAIEVLEHLHHPEDAVVEARRCLKDNGTLIVLVPNENNLLFRFIWFFWVMGKGRIWKHAHPQKFTPKSCCDLLKKEGFKVLEVRKFILGMLMAFKAVKV